MTMSAPSVLIVTARCGLLILVISMVLVFYRIVKGPKPADRIIALDLLSILVVAFIGLLSIHTGAEVILDVGIAYALIAFLGTVAFARYLERTVSRRGPQSVDTLRRSIP